MGSMQFANTILEWERRIEFEQVRRKNQRGEPYVNYAAVPQPSRKEHNSIFERIFGRRQKQSTQSEKPCEDTQPC